MALFTDIEIHVVAGLLLPIWKHLPNESRRVYRFQTDSGERIIGRKVSPAWVASAAEIGASSLSPDAAFAALMDRKTVLDLAEGLQLRRVRVMDTNRIELSGFTRDAGPAQRLLSVPRDHLVEAAHVRAD
jgi:protein strawberry notch